MVYDQLRNPLTRAQNDRDRSDLVEILPDILGVAHDRYLALRPHLRDCPDRFFSRDAVTAFLSWLKRRDGNDRVALQSYFSDNEIEISRALLFLREINREDWHDEILEGMDDVDLLRFVDRHVHGTYVRLVEAVLTPIVRVVAYFSRLDRRAGTDGLDVWAVVQELRRGPVGGVVAPYHHTVRNGIAHGGIIYRQNEITYRDKRGNKETLQVRDVVRLCDDLLDECNGVAAGLKVFVLTRHDDGYVVPQELLIQELQEETRTPWWEVEGCLQSSIPNRSQLIVYTRPNCRDVRKIQWSVVQTGIMAEALAAGYDRYFLSLRSNKALPGFAAFDGARLRAVRESGASDLSEYGKALEDGLIFFVPRMRLPKLFLRVDTLFHSFRLQWPVAVAQRRVLRGIPEVKARNAAIHRNGWRCVLKGDVVIEGVDSGEMCETVRSYRKRLIRTVRRAARRGMSSGSIARYLPLGFAQVNVFAKDFRRRRLSGFGLGADLVGTVRLHGIKRIRSPDILGSTVEVRERWRIAWNRSWIETSGIVVETPAGWRRAAPQEPSGSTGAIAS